MSLSLQMDETADEGLAFSFDAIVPKLWDILKDAVKSNNYPIIGLFMVGGGALMKIANADIPVVTYRTMSVQQAEQAPYGGGWLWLSQALGLTGGPTLPAGTQRTIMNLSDILVLGGIALIGSPLIGRLQSLLP